jgi:adenosine deaminase
MSLPLSHIQAFPKAELHRHIDGAVPLHAVRSMLMRRGMSEVPLRTGRIISVKDAHAFDAEYRFGGGKSLADSLAVFDLVLSLMQDPEGIEEIAYEVVLELARENILYAELTFAPAYHTRAGLGYSEVLDSFLRGIKRARNDSGVLTKLILAIQREAYRKEKPEDARDPYGLELARTALEYRRRHPEIAALGLVCDEFSHPPETYREAFEMTFESSLGRVPHAGEMGTPEGRERNVRTALELMRAGRIGHGIPVGASSELMSECRRRHVGVECNPWSNILAGFIGSVEELHIDRLYGEGVCFSINSDDPALFRKSLSDNIHLVCDAYGWGEERLVGMTRNALESAFLSADEREELYRECSRKTGTRFS